jgi:hypothetical protein
MFIIGFTPLGGLPAEKRRFGDFSKNVSINCWAALEVLDGPCRGCIKNTTKLLFCRYAVMALLGALTKRQAA